MIKQYQYFSSRLHCNVKLTYSDGLLQHVEIETPRNVEEHPVMHFHNNETRFIQSCIDHDIKYTELTAQVTFEMFWEAMDYKVDKAEAMRIWEKLPEAEKIAAYRYIPAYKSWLKRNNEIGKKYPKTYLRQKPWIQ